ncbi:MAG TPA: hypothetical protein VFK05_14570 [Polyangiaceae bacterium]|nr:hypothetical protein [Polyangiaceae bacterium]
MKRINHSDTWRVLVIATFCALGSALGCAANTGDEQRSETAGEQVEGSSQAIVSNFIQIDKDTAEGRAITDMYVVLEGNDSQTGVHWSDYAYPGYGRVWNTRYQLGWNPDQPVDKLYYAYDSGESIQVVITDVTNHWALNNARVTVWFRINGMWHTDYEDIGTWGSAVKLKVNGWGGTRSSDNVYRGDFLRRI